MKTFPMVRSDTDRCMQERDRLEAMIERYLGALNRGILTPEEALSHLRQDYAIYAEGA